MNSNMTIDNLKTALDKLDMIETSYKSLQESLALLIKQRSELIKDNMDMREQLNKCICKDLKESN